MSYFRYQPHQQLSGLGACGCGGSGCGCGGFGAVEIGGGITFNAAKAWSGWKACSSGGGSACVDAVDSIRAALGKLGYGELPFGQPWGGSDSAAIKSFAAEVNLPSSAIPTEAVLNAMEAMLKEGAKPGPEPSTSVMKVGGTYMTRPSGLVTAGIVAAGVVGLAAIGGLVLLSKRKGKKTVTVKA